MALQGSPKWQKLNQNIEFERMETHLKDSSPIYIGIDIAEDKLLAELSVMNPDQVFIVTDNVVGKLHGSQFLNKIGSHFKTHLLTFGGGEPNKTLFTFSELADQMFENNVSKGSVVVALGGGIVGNVAGLIAAQIFRGIPFIEIPTTFLAQTDSIMSSKQAVNSNYGKNMLGVYYAQSCTIVDVRFLLTENERSIRSGLVETVKNGLINDPKLFEFMERNIPRFRLNDINELKSLVKISIKSKIDIIKTDPSEKQRGMILEYGHTVGHAVEKLMRGNMTHGEGVAVGMVTAAQIANHLGYLKDWHVQLHEEVLGELGMPLKLPQGINADAVLNVIEHDNKREVDGIKYVLLEDIGVVKTENDKYMVRVPESLVREVLKSHES